MDKKYIINETIIDGVVIKIAKTYLLVSFDGFVGICHISQVSDYLISDLNHLFDCNKKYNFIIIANDGFEQFTLSYKQIHPKFLKSHRDIIPTPRGFDNLKKDLEERLKRNN